MRQVSNLSCSIHTSKLSCSSRSRFADLLGIKLIVFQLKRDSFYTKNCLIGLEEEPQEEEEEEEGAVKEEPLESELNKTAANESNDEVSTF